MASICRIIRRSISYQASRLENGRGHAGGKKRAFFDKEEANKMNRKAKRALRKKAIIEKRARARGDRA